MRRPLAILAVATMTWSNVAALQCATAGAHDVRADEALEHQHARHAAQGDGEERTPSEADGAGGHQDDGCRTVMTCGTPMIRPKVARGTLRIATPSVRVDEPFVDAYSAIPSAADPPPPKPFA